MTSKGDCVWGEPYSKSGAAYREPIEEWGADAWPGAEDAQLGILHQSTPTLRTTSGSLRRS